jgi:hypothetical protein
MPEQDTFDLDAAFRGLADDIAGLSSPRGAGTAMATSRRRRRATIGGVVAGLALVVGATAVLGAGLGGHHDTVSPVDHLPAPAPFDGAHLTTATLGWTPAWGPETNTVRDEIAQTFGGYCWADIRGGGRTALKAVASTSRTGALAEMTDFGTRSAEAGASWQHVERQLGGCPQATLVSSFRIPSGAEGRTYRIAPNGWETSPEYVWIVTTGHQIGELKIFGQQGPLPPANDPRVARFFLAALQDPSSYIQGDRSSSEASPRVDEHDFARALGAWSSGWKSSGRADAHVDSACYPKHWWSTSWASSHGGLGVNGHQDLAAYHSATEARAAATSLSDAFRSCDSARYAVTGPLDNPRSLLVAASGPVVVWVAQHDDTVAVVRVPSAGTAPPQHVTVDVGGLMLAALTAYFAQGQ